MARQTPPLAQADSLHLRGLASLPIPVTVYRANPIDVLTAEGQAAVEVSVVEPRDIELEITYRSFRLRLTSTGCQRPPGFTLPTNPLNGSLNSGMRVKKQI